MDDKYTFRVGDDAWMLSTQPFVNLNMIDSTCQYMALKNATTAGFYAGVLACESSPGIFYRAPFNKSNTSVDDYLMAVTIRMLAIETLSAARRKLGFLDVNIIPSPAQWLYRFQGFWNHMKICAGSRVWPLGRFMWALAIFLAARKDISFQDSWIQSHMMILCKERYGYKSWLGDLAIKYWWSKKTKTTSDIMIDYLGIPDHPLVQEWEGRN